MSPNVANAEDSRLQISFLPRDTPKAWCSRSAHALGREGARAVQARANPGPRRHVPNRSATPNAARPRRAADHERPSRHGAPQTDTPTPTAHGIDRRARKQLPAVTHSAQSRPATSCSAPRPRARERRVPGVRTEYRRRGSSRRRHRRHSRPCHGPSAAHRCDRRDRARRRPLDHRRHLHRRCHRRGTARRWR